MLGVWVAIGIRSWVRMIGVGVGRETELGRGNEVGMTEIGLRRGRRVCIS